LRQHSALILDASVQDFERATGPWQVEWVVIPESFIAASGALSQANFMLDGLEVKTERMASNLDITKGLIVAEAVMMELAKYTGRQAAHEIVYDACRAASEQNKHFAQILATNQQITEHLNPDQIETLTSPENYLGLAPEMVDRVLSHEVSASDDSTR